MGKKDVEDENLQEVLDDGDDDGEGETGDGDDGAGDDGDGEASGGDSEGQTSEQSTPYGKFKTFGGLLKGAEQLFKKLGRKFDADRYDVDDADELLKTYRKAEKALALLGGVDDEQEPPDDSGNEETQAELERLNSFLTRANESLGVPPQQQTPQQQQVFVPQSTGELPKVDYSVFGNPDEQYNKLLANPAQFIGEVLDAIGSPILKMALGPLYQHRDRVESQLAFNARAEAFADSHPDYPKYRKRMIELFRKNKALGYMTGEPDPTTGRKTADGFEMAYRIAKLEDKGKGKSAGTPKGQRVVGGGKPPKKPSTVKDQEKRLVDDIFRE
jgi:hypothetical protein